MVWCCNVRHAELHVLAERLSHKLLFNEVIDGEDGLDVTAVEQDVRKNAHEDEEDAKVAEEEAWCIEDVVEVLDSLQQRLILVHLRMMGCCTVRQAAHGRVRGGGAATRTWWFLQQRVPGEEGLQFFLLKPVAEVEEEVGCAAGVLQLLQYTCGVGEHGAAGVTDNVASVVCVPLGQAQHV